MNSKEIQHANEPCAFTNALLARLKKYDPDTYQHSLNVAEYVNIICQKLKRDNIYQDALTEKYINMVIQGAYLHDIGKLRIPHTVLDKPEELSDYERALINTHTLEGQKIITTEAKSKQIPKALVIVMSQCAFYHHERWDGTGYLSALKQENIPLCARIVAVADVFDAVTSDRVYGKKHDLAGAKAILQRGCGTHFDPKIEQSFYEIAEIMSMTPP